MLNVNQNNALTIRYVLWANLILGLHGMYIYSLNDTQFNLIIGAANIWVWVYFREVVNSHLPKTEITKLIEKYKNYLS